MWVMVWRWTRLSDCHLGGYDDVWYYDYSAMTMIYGSQIWGTFHWRCSRRNSRWGICFCSHQNSNELIATNIRVWCESCDTVIWAKMLAIWWPGMELQWNGISHKNYSHYLHELEMKERISNLYQYHDYLMQDVQYLTVNYYMVIASHSCLI